MKPAFKVDGKIATAFRLVQDGPRDRVVGGLHDFFEDGRGGFEPFELVVLRDGQTGGEVQGEPRDQQSCVSDVHAVLVRRRQA